MIDPYAAMQPRALKLTQKELLTLTFTQDKAETRDDFLQRILNEAAAMHSVHSAHKQAMDEFEAKIETDWDLALNGGYVVAAPSA
jgi:hypothetical protein